MPEPIYCVVCNFEGGQGTPDWKLWTVEKAIIELRLISEENDGVLALVPSRYPFGTECWEVINALTWHEAAERAIADGKTMQEAIWNAKAKLLAIANGHGPTKEFYSERAEFEE